ncbi:MBL fold metallo-hydrolase [Brevibacillus sp. SYP-B805]|uniref:MBL fold metallo-hydrolase n=1 Tax=Brevibacillus sp. SYP-B805 TaxID=1578199 RepID=UPI0013ED57FC|nr:MBL fold metallo-hydrolase [Brevibacillus sp. SYP-B805]NGQ95951.1 MBL fold metallo-hydrolase [Brevibacillus sp. SYP-B805]
MRMQLVRHATLLVEYGGKRLLVDPMFSPAGALPATPNTPNQRPNPLVDLPMDPRSLLDIDAIVVTHTHRDHLDDAAVAALPKHLPLFSQPEDEEKLRGFGFTRVQPVSTEAAWEGIVFHRTGGQHGTGEIGKAMGPVSGLVLQAEGEPTLYIAGDTVWCDEMEEALAAHQPDIVVVNAGGARFLTGGPITMTAEDIVQTCRKAPQARVVAVHMEAWNHCLLTRRELAEALAAAQLTHQVHIPADGEWLSF